VIRRFLSCKRLFDPDREHIHHKLLGRGISHRQAVLLLYGVSACLGLFSLLLLNPGGTAVAMVLVVVGIGVLIGVRQLRYHEFMELGRVANRTLNQRHVIANGISVRRTTEALTRNSARFCGNVSNPLDSMGSVCTCRQDYPATLISFPLPASAGPNSNSFGIRHQRPRTQIGA
jgi:hypothetical protein